MLVRRGRPAGEGPFRLAVWADCEGGPVAWARVASAGQAFGTFFIAAEKAMKSVWLMPYPSIVWPCVVPGST